MTSHDVSYGGCLSRITALLCSAASPMPNTQAATNVELTAFPVPAADRIPWIGPRLPATLGSAAAPRVSRRCHGIDLICCQSPAPWPLHAGAWIVVAAWPGCPLRPELGVLTPA
jgi:hypothetical protein